MRLVKGTFYKLALESKNGNDFDKILHLFPRHDYITFEYKFDIFSCLIIYSNLRS